MHTENRRLVDDRVSDEGAFKEILGNIYEHASIHTSKFF
jgi:hypothetical protein